MAYVIIGIIVAVMGCAQIAADKVVTKNGGENHWFWEKK